MPSKRFFSQKDRKDWFIFAGGFLASILLGSTVMLVQRGS